VAQQRPPARGRPRATISIGSTSRIERAAEEQRRLLTRSSKPAQEWQLTCDSVDDLILLLDAQAAFSARTAPSPRTSAGPSPTS